MQRLGREFRVRLTLVTLFLVGVVVPCSGGEPSADIGRLIRNLPQPQVTCGALIVDLQSGETVYSHQSATPLVPASNQKLLAMATALDTFGPQGTFRTVLAVRGDDLILVGDGDPVLGDARLAKEGETTPSAFLDVWAQRLIDSGFQTVGGDFVIDATIFDEQYVHPDWEDADLVKWYGAPVGGLNLNNNCVELTVWPASAGADALWSLYPPCSAVEVVNRCTSSPGVKKAVPMVGRKPGTFELVVRGKVGKRGTLQSISIPNPSLFTATAIREHLATKGVTVAGELRFERVRTASGDLPADCRVIAEERTALPDVLRRIGRDSQNMCAEALLKRIGYEWSRLRQGQAAVGSWENGRLAVTDFLTRIGCDTTELVVSDGSGLARSNRVTAAEFVRVLTYMHKHPHREVFVNSLAGNRTGGTLKKRMASVDGDVYAKTGYVRGVRSLSGYVKSTAGRWYAFSIIFNGFKGSSAPYNKIHQQVCQILSHIPDAP